MQRYTEVQSRINIFIPNITYKILSFKQDVYLIEIEDGQRLVVNLNDQTIHSTKTLDSGIDFEGTGHALDQLITEVIVKQYNKNVHEKIMTILNLTSKDGWSIVDSVGNLHLVHYNDDADMNLVGHLRGVLVDVEEMRVLVSSYGYTPSVKIDYLSYLNGQMTILDENHTQHVFEESTTIIKPVYEGVIIRVIYYQGQTYRLTHKKIRPLKSRWGSHPYFTKMYTAGGGPKDDQLFDLTKESSTWCYVFLVVHPKLLMATRQNVVSPYVVLLSAKQMWETDDENVDMIQHFKLDENKLINNINEPFVHHPKAISLYEANHHLSYGYYPPCYDIQDIRQTAGESVILYKLDQNGDVIDLVKVNSSSYDYRFKLRGNDPNPYHRFFDLVPHSYHLLFDSINYAEYKQKFIVFDNYLEADLTGIYNHLGFILYLSEAEMPMQERKNREYILKNIWLNYVLALPFSFQLEAISYLEKFIKDRTSVVTWLQANNYHNNLDTNEISERGKNLIMSARHTANDICRQQPHKKYHDTVQEVIRNFVHKEYGTSLYALVKKMKK